MNAFLPLHRSPTDLALQMAASTPTKDGHGAAQTFETQVTNYIDRMPAQPKTGDKNKDGQIESTKRLLQHVVEGCLLKPDAILKVHHAFMDFTETEQRQYHPAASRDDQFMSLVPIAKVDDDFILQHILSESDLDKDDLPIVCKASDNIEMLFEASYQLSTSLRMLPELQVKSVIQRFLDARKAQCGNPLKCFKAKGGLGDRSGRLVFKEAGSYVPTYDNMGILTKLRYHGGDEVDVTDGRIKMGTPIRYNFSDWRACFPNPPFADIKLHLFFKAAKKGPHANDLVEFNQKSKKYAEAAAHAFQAGAHGERAHGRGD